VLLFVQTANEERRRRYPASLYCISSLAHPQTPASASTSAAAAAAAVFKAVFPI